jgi:hypothetical protein
MALFSTTHTQNAFIGVPPLLDTATLQARLDNIDRLQDKATSI